MDKENANASAGNKSEAHVFRPKARLLRMLGEELISDEVIAVVELVKNAYDADSTSCRIVFRKAGEDGGTIEISDDGNGMTAGQLLGSWMQPGTDAKRQTRVSPGGRPLLGKKGVGRFATDKLARFVFICTKVAVSNRWVVSRVDFDRFNDDNLFLDQVHVAVRQLESKDAAEHGTRIKLRALRTKWESEHFNKLRLALLRLASPFKSHTVKNFEISMSIDGEIQELGGLPLALLEKAPCVIKAKLGIVSKDDGANSEKTARFSVSVNGVDRHVPPIGLDEARCGPFEAEIYVWPRDPGSMELAKSTLSLNANAAREILNSWSGISIYRDGFRVYPYGEEGYDWLNLDREKINSPTGRLGNRQVLGAVFISDSTNPELRDQTNREGLVESDAYEDFKTLVKRAVREGANFLLSEAKPKPTQSESDAHASPTRRHLVELPALDELRTALDSEKPIDKKQIASFAMQLTDQAKSAEDAIFEEISRYRRLLSLGVVAARVAHEIRQQVELIRRKVYNAQNQLMTPGGSHEFLGPLFVAIDTSASIIAREVKAVVPFLRARRILSSVDVWAVAEQVRGAVEEQAKKKGATVTVEGCGPALALVRADYGELFQAVHNLVDNSLYWIGKEGGAVRIMVESSGSQVSVTVRDNGPGIPKAYESDVFAPYWSQKPGGSGIGLAITGEIASDYGGALSLVWNSPGNGCAFRVELPRLVSTK